jgi:hypothetical protein
VKDELIRLECHISDIDPAMFFLHTEDKLNGIFCCHVDDFLHDGDECLEKVLTQLRKRFVAGTVQERQFDYIGFRISQKRKEIIFDQSRYVKSIESRQIDTQRVQNKQEVLTSEEQTLFRKIIGQINCVVQGTRPDLAFELIDLSTKLKEATMSDLSVIRFPQLSNSVGDWKIAVFTDASLCNINSGTGSTAAYIVW